jgi:hypothetical protein
MRAPLLDHAIAEGGIEITADEDDADVRIDLAHLPESLPPRHRGKLNVRDHDCDLVPVGSKRVDRRLPVDGRQDLVALFRQDLADGRHEHLLVLDEENRLGAPETPRFLHDLDLGLRRKAREDRQIETELGAPPRLRIEIDESVVGGDDAVDHGEPHARSTGSSFRREERLEGAIARLRIHADALVADRDADVEVAVRLRRDLSNFVARTDGRRDAQLAAVGHRVAGVDAEVQKRLVELVLIGVDQRQVGSEIARNADVPGKVRRDHLDDFAEDLVDVDDPETPLLLAGERQKMPHHRRAPGDRLLDRFQALGLSPGALGPPGALGVRRNDVQDVVEVVGHAAGHAPDGVHLLELAKLLLELALLGEMRPPDLRDVLDRDQD